MWPTHTNSVLSTYVTHSRKLSLKHVTHSRKPSLKHISDCSHKLSLKHMWPAHTNPVLSTYVTCSNKPGLNGSCQSATDTNSYWGLIRGNFSFSSAILHQAICTSDILNKAGFQPGKKYQLHPEPTFFCSSLVESGPTWLCPATPKFRAKQCLFYITVKPGSERLGERGGCRGLWDCMWVRGCVCGCREG